MTWRHGRRLRQAAQVFCLGLFVVLLIAAPNHHGAANPAVSLFFRLDPLAALSAMLAARQWLPTLALAGLTVLATLALCRVWCGWVCPLGTILEWVSFRGARKRGAALSPRWRSVKYILLAVIVTLALLGNLTLLGLDPIALLTRAAATALWPALNVGVNTLEKTLYQAPFLRPLVDGLESALRGPVLPVKAPAFRDALPIAALLGGVVALNLAADRFWCRYLCPLGGLLGLLSKVALFRPLVGPACNRCTKCVQVCRPGAMTRQGDTFTVQPAECTLCLDCLAHCPQRAIGLRPAPRPDPAPAPALSRRQALGALGLGLGAALLLRADLRLRLRHPLLIRPPGAQDEERFLAQCVRCTQCLAVCPTSALQPARAEAGAEGVGTPVLVPRAGYCDYGCRACGQACPSGAIPPLALADKRAAVIGRATVNRDRCLPWASATPCIVCEEMCPTPQKSIRLEEAEVVNSAGETLTVQRPVVLRDICIGCGICENHCPLEGEAAIRVYGA